MKLSKEQKGWRTRRWLLSGLVLTGLALVGTKARAQSVRTTTVQGTVYLANGHAGAGTLDVSWPAFTTAEDQAVVAGRISVSIAADGLVSVNLAPNAGATPAGLYYTAVYHLSDGTTSTEYWVVPAEEQAALGQVRAAVMPAAQAVQVVSKAYVDQRLAANGGSASGALNRVDLFTGAEFGAKLQACVNSLSATYGGICDARNFTGTLPMGSDVTIAASNTTVLLPCATIDTTHRVVIPAGTRNVSLRGCALRGGSAADGSAGGTAFRYSGSGAAIQVGDSAYAVNTPGFHLDNVVVNTMLTASATAQGLAAYRTQEMNLEKVYFLGNQNQTGMTLDGTGNYTGGSFYDNTFGGFGTAVSGIGHQIENAAATDGLNASVFVRLHINCPTNGGNPISGTVGIDLKQGDGNTITGGDVEGCSTMLHLGPGAKNNTIVGLRNENSTNQVVADAGSAYNNWMTGGTMFTGKLTDNGTRNSFLDTFHRSFNGMNGDWYGSQQDATVTNHYRLGIGAGNERGLLDRFQTDDGYRWTTGLSDATAGEQFYQIKDELNNVYRLSIGQYNNGQASTNNQTVINAAGTGAVVLNGSTNSGTGGLVIGSGGANETTVATIGSTGNAQFTGNLLVGGTTTFTGSTTVRNQADAEIDQFLWAGATANQKESFIYKDYTGASQWYLVKDASNNWALNSATGGLDSIKAYQSTNSGDTYINAVNSSGAVRINYETGSGAAFKIYGGSASTLYESFTATTAWQVPGLAAASGHNCLQIDNSGYISNTGAACGFGSGTVTQVALTVPADESVSGTPITGSGTLAISRNNQAANLFLAGPCSGEASTPTYRALCTADIPNNAANTTGNAATATKLASNTLECLDGWDHLPCTVFVQTPVSESSATGSYATVWTSTYAGVYRVTGFIYGTTASTTSYSITEYVKAVNSGQSAGNGYGVSTAQIGSSISSGNGYPVLFNLAASAAVQVQSAGSGTNTGGVWTRAIVIERLQ